MNGEGRGAGLLAAFATVPDPRSPQGRRHPLPAILALATAAMLSGARSLYAIAQWGRLQPPAVVATLGFTRVRTPAVSTRRLWASTTLTGYLDWPGVRQVVRMERTCTRRGQPTREVRYAITSLGPEIGATTLLGDVRGHWASENRLHWVRDVTFQEDASQVQSGVAPQIMAALRNTVLGLVRGAGWTNIAAALRHYAWQPAAALAVLGLTPP